VLAVATTIAAILLGGTVCLGLLALLAVLLPAIAAGMVRRVLAMALLLALPLALSAAVVNVLFTNGDGSVLATIGPISVTGDGVRLAAEVAFRVMTMAGAVSLFYLTTRPSELVASLEAHGASARLTFVIHNTIAMIPRLAERAADVAAAQRARGLDTQGSLWHRARGVVAVAAPTVLGSVAEAEARTLALETRGFGAPGRRTLLWVPPDSRLQRLARWSVAVALVLLMGARISGLALPC
jgi:energy-coupling factor transport system permease protein